MKKAALFIFSALSGAILLFLVIRYVGWKEIKEVLVAFSGFEGLAVIGVSFLIWVVEIWRWRFIFRVHGENLPFLKLGEILIASFSLFYLFSPAAIFGAEGFKIYSFRKKFSIGWEKSLAVSLIEKAQRWSVMIFFLASGAVVFPFLTDYSFENYRIIASAFMGALSLALAYFYYKSVKKKSFFSWILRLFSVKDKTEKIEKEIFYFYNPKKSFMWKGLGITFLKYLLIFIRIWLVLVFLAGIGFHAFIALVVMFFLYLSYLLPIPANLGILEASQFVAFKALGMGSAAGISFSFILRGAELVIALIGILFLLKMSLGFIFGKIRNIR